MSSCLRQYNVPWIHVALAAAAVAIYWPIHGFEYINLDDMGYVTGNPYILGGLTLDGLRWVFTSSHMGNWHPLTSISHMLDCELFGPDSGAHHLVNLVFHVTNTLLLFEVLRRCTGAVWASAFVAAAFALHPLHVESVAWVSARKDVLSMFFWILAMGAYFAYVRRTRAMWYVLTFLALAAGLMAKPMLMTVPAVFLLMDFWPLQRLTGRPFVKTILLLVWEKLPLFALSLASGVVTLLTQRYSGAVAGMRFFPLANRIANAVNSYLTYAAKTFWPAGMAVFYPYPSRQVTPWPVMAAAGLLLAITAVIFKLGRRRPYLITGWLWYLVTLFPVIGILQVGEQGMADRYTYIPLTGLFLIVAWAGRDAAMVCRFGRLVIPAAAALCIAAMALVTRVQLSYWRSSLPLFEHALAVTDNNHRAHMCIAKPLVAAGRIDEAIQHYYEGMKVSPNFAAGHVELGLLLEKAGRLDEAARHFNMALGIEPPAPLRAHYNLGRIKAAQGNTDKAVEHFRKVLQLSPAYADGYMALGNVLAAAGRYDEAAEHYKQVVALAADYIPAHNRLISTLLAAGKTREAVEHLEWIVQAKGDPPGPSSHLAWILATNSDRTVRDPARSLELAQKACERTGYDSPELVRTLAAALASNGDFGEAVRFAEKALDLARSQQLPDGAVAAIEKQLDMYRQGQPYTEPAAGGEEEVGSSQ